MTGSLATRASSNGVFIALSNVIAGSGPGASHLTDAHEMNDHQSSGGVAATNVNGSIHLRLKLRPLGAAPDAFDLESSRPTSPIPAISKLDTAGTVIATTFIIKRENESSQEVRLDDSARRNMAFFPIMAVKRRFLSGSSAKFVGKFKRVRRPSVLLPRSLTALTETTDLPARARSPCLTGLSAQSAQRNTGAAGNKPMSEAA